MMLSQAGPSRTRGVRGPVHGPFVAQPRPGRVALAPSRRPGPSRPAGAPLRYHRTGVAFSTAPHRTRPVTLTTTVGLALLAGVITLWLGLVGHFGGMINGDPADAAARVPDRLAVVRVEDGESLRDVAARVAPDAPVRRVADRIRELNALDSTTLSAGQTLIVPVG
ncbi:LysM peptidoglycan-binding domain-containing protein [Mycobacterium lacus]|uniref:LysM peptidoglycan-binding domain-containing protein n=1 Tax=Mycobacterium lacus TaxID=169765 RepID=UPI00355766C8